MFAGNSESGDKWADSMVSIPPPVPSITTDSQRSAARNPIPATYRWGDICGS